MYEQIRGYNQNSITCFMLGRIYQYEERVEKDLIKDESLYNIRWQLDTVTYMA